MPDKDCIMYQYLHNFIKFLDRNNVIGFYTNNDKDIHDWIFEFINCKR